MRRFRHTLCGAGKSFGLGLGLPVAARRSSGPMNLAAHGRQTFRLGVPLEVRVRKIVLYTLMSLDGDVDDPGGYFTADQPDHRAPIFDPVMVENERTIIEKQDTVLLGRHMYDEWSGYWPTSDEQPFADFINGVQKVVVTSTRLTRRWHNAKPMAGPIDKTVAHLKDRPGGDIGVHGSIQLAQSLLAADLVDELQLVVGPAVGFNARRLFTTIGDIRRFRLLSAKPTPTGSLLLGYALR
jgi:dihydrofolate reductase